MASTPSDRLTARGRARACGCGGVPGPTAEPTRRDVPTQDGTGADASLNAVLDATRALLWIQTKAEAAAVARDLIQALGGRVVLARGSDGQALPVDVSFGEADPLLPVADLSSVPRMLLERHLPAFVGDAHRALELADRTIRLAEDAAVDPLTGLANRRMLGRALGRLRPENTVIMIDLDHFKAINDTLGHQEGDRVLRELGRTLASTLRASDHAGRYGGEEFVVILAGSEAESFLQRLRSEWTSRRPHPVSFSAGIAPVAPDAGRALEAADRAMYRAKNLGRDQWQWATKEEYL